MAQRIVRQKRTSTLDVGGAGPVAQQDTPVLGQASRSTLLSAVCIKGGIRALHCVVSSLK